MQFVKKIYPLLVSLISYGMMVHNMYDGNINQYLYMILLGFIEGY